ncbi:3-hydroxyacyl-CoA dehydrogenase NAD-binding domain-containing protein [Rhodoligotrophos defluvii]|uniref:3-hydroxyacyl-CoA dehydrogenase NAD-binding domain-containing protein n=1 Tax=Rhodoligotrophos defluvii TaxID=2561934 RepID=UPI0010C94834|nr:3-hydroxyacyl-CoA dehydrogenase NAD-binding domain-containing protein [Rhodoligotrophos defluvii]
MRDVRTIGVVGLGLIGARWAAVFAHAGLDVVAQDADRARWDAFEASCGELFAEIEALAPAKCPRGRITFTARLEDGFQAVDFVQENAPETLDLKRQLLRDIEGAVAADVVIASSSSALLVSDMQADCTRPERVVLGHPFNPAHLMPLVEIVGGQKTAPWAVEQARQVYEACGKKPVVLSREITGHIALRLMGAMWREAFYLIRSGVATAADIDRAFCYGPGPKWTLQGSFVSNHLGAGGIEEFLMKYGPTYEAIWSTLGDAELDPETRAAVIRQTGDIVGGRSEEELRVQRDAGLIAILKAQAENGAL